MWTLAGQGGGERFKQNVAREHMWSKFQRRHSTIRNPDLKTLQKLQKKLESQRQRCDGLHVQDLDACVACLDLPENLSKATPAVSRRVHQLSVAVLSSVEPSLSVVQPESLDPESSAPKSQTEASLPTHYSC